MPNKLSLIHFYRSLKQPCNPDALKLILQCLYDDVMDDGDRFEQLQGICHSRSAGALC